MSGWIYDPKEGRCRKTDGEQAMSGDKIDAIRARHNDAAWRYYELPSQMHDDRALLLAEVDRQRAEIERLLQAIGLVTTTVSDMEIDIENPVGMMQRVVAEIKRLRAELDVEMLRLAACNVVAMADTPESAIEARKMKPEYRSATLSRVERRVDEVIALRAENERLRAEIDGLEAELALMKSGFEIAYRAMGDKP